MVKLELPAELTKEELMLQALYGKLKKKKKAVEDYKASKSESERLQQGAKPQPRDARDAREVAQKLIKSGAIALNKTPKRPEEFKRSLGLERKLNTTEKAATSYEPFLPSESESTEPTAKKRKVKKLAECFVPSTDPVNTIGEKPISKPEANPTKGNTIFVYGRKLSEEFLREHFAVFGKIIHVAFRKEKIGFVTFEKQESADEAIIQMNGKTISSIELTVSMSRRQFDFKQVIDDSTSFPWVSAAATYDRREAHHDTRELKPLDDNIFE